MGLNDVARGIEEGGNAHERADEQAFRSKHQSSVSA